MNGVHAELFITFAKIGAFSFGGGYGMIPLIEKETVENKKWVSGEELLDVIAIAESTPGPIAINAATFIGHKAGGLAGAACATAGVVLPSFIIISAISFVLQAFQELKCVRYAFMGVRAGVLALILKALWSMYSQCSKDIFSYAVMGLAFLAVAFLGINAIMVIIAAALCGIIVSRVRMVKP